MKLPEINYSLQTLRGDVFGGITAAVVMLPISLAFGVASGLGAVAGLYGAVAVGFFAAVSGGTRTQISGPTGPMAVVVAVIVVNHADNIAAAFTIIIMAGAIQVLLGVMRIGRFVSFTPYSVISGFMSGIGIIIILVQILPLLGAPIAAGGTLGAVRAFPNAIADINLNAFAIAIASLALIVLWPRRLTRILPPALAALALGTLMSIWWLSDAPIIGAVPTGLPEFNVPDISLSTLLRALQPALVIALLGSIDTLLTSLVADSVTHTRHNPDLTLMGQGVGNMTAGFIGALPGAGATMGTVVNINAGGRTQIAGILCAAILLALVLGLGRYVSVVPHAVLAGILLKVGWDIIDWRFITRIHRIQRAYLLIMLLTLGLTVFVDLVTAVAIGMIAAAIAHARQFERLELDSVVSVPLLDRTFMDTRQAEDADEDALFSARAGLVALRGTFTVASANKLINTVSVDIGEHEVVILDFTETSHLDDSAALIMEQLIETAYEQDTDCVIMGLREPASTTLDSLNALKQVPAENFADTLEDAREIAQRILEG